MNSAYPPPAPSGTPLRLVPSPQHLAHTGVGASGLISLALIVIVFGCVIALAAWMGGRR